MGLFFAGGTVCDGDGGIDRESERGVRGAGCNDGRIFKEAVARLGRPVAARVMGLERLP